MRKYGCFHAILLSFYSRDLYRDVAQNWGGRVLLYLLLLLSLCALVITLDVQFLINKDFPPLVEKVTAQAPELKIVKGIVSTPQNRPYLLRDPDTKKVFAVIDTSGKYTTIENSDLTFLLTKTYFMSQSDRHEIKKSMLPTSLNADLKPDEVKHVIDKGASWFWVIIFPAILFFTYIYRILQAFFYAIFGRIMAAFTSSSLGYFDILKLTMVTVTPAILIKLLVSLTFGFFYLDWLVYFLIAMGYLLFAITSV